MEWKRKAVLQLQLRVIEDARCADCYRYCLFVYLHPSEFTCWVVHVPVNACNDTSALTRH